MLQTVLSGRVFSLCEHKVLSKGPKTPSVSLNVLVNMSCLLSLQLFRHFIQHTEIAEPLPKNACKLNEVISLVCTQ